MNRKKFLLPALFLVNALVFSQESSETAIQECCGLSPHPQRIEIRHIESKGIGYKQGYTTIEGFFTPTVLDDSSLWTPFIDLRGHIFNDGKAAVNAGIGLRYLTSRVWGINAYYDYRLTHHKHYDQLGIGLETLGQILDFRINGYLPFGKKKKDFGHFQFGKFSGHHMILSRKREFAMIGGNAEIGAHVKKFKHVAIYAAAGPYYFEGEEKNAWGGEGRLVLSLFDYIRLQLNGSYDKIFHGIFQGELSLILPFGRRKEIKRRNCYGCSKEYYTCKQESIFRERAMQRVDRFEIIVMDRKQHRDGLAINPVTGQPYFFWFVDNTSHSNGTFESPFNTLVAAQNASSVNDVIYVFPGDGTTNGMNAGITLKDNQRLFGSGINQKLPTTLGSIKIPALSEHLPIITKSTNGVINCANNNEISGMQVTFKDIQAIVCTNITNTFIHDNVIDIHSSAVGGSPSSNGVIIQSSGGQIIISNNTFNYDANSSFGIHLVSNTPGATFLITNNQFTSAGSSSSTGIEIGLPSIPTGPGNFNTLTISHNQFIRTGTTTSGKVMGGFGLTGPGHLIIDQNFFSQMDSHSNGIVNIGFMGAPGDLLIADITNNTWQQSTTFSGVCFDIANNNVGVSSCVTFKGNQTNNPTPVAYQFVNAVAGES